MTPGAKPPSPKGEVPLERALSKLGIASRTETRRWILAGRLAVDDAVQCDPQHPVAPEKACFALDGMPLRGAGSAFLLFYKPRGLVTTRSDERGRATVYDLLPEALRHLKPVGRLDLASSGLLLFTGDNRLAAWLTDPANDVPRIYAITVRGRVTPEEVMRLESGIEEGGETLKPLQVVLRKASGRESHLTITLTEGKNREIRRLMTAVGHEVTLLKRVGLGGLTLQGLRPGESRELTPEEIRAAFPGAPLLPRRPAKGAVREVDRNSPRR
jgi:23S rRNA pseudouridine2605 synthase